MFADTDMLMNLKRLFEGLHREFPITPESHPNFKGTHAITFYEGKVSIEVWVSHNGGVRLFSAVCDDEELAKPVDVFVQETSAFIRAQVEELKWAEKVSAVREKLTEQLKTGE